MGNIIDAFAGAVAELERDRGWKNFQLREALYSALALAHELGYGTVAEALQCALNIVNQAAE
jgi:hypothetical protein